MGVPGVLNQLAVGRMLEQELHVLQNLIGSTPTFNPAAIDMEAQAVVSFVSILDSGHRLQQMILQRSNRPKTTDV